MTSKRFNAWVDEGYPWALEESLKSSAAKKQEEPEAPMVDIEYDGPEEEARDEGVEAQADHEDAEAAASVQDGITSPTPLILQQLILRASSKDGKTRAEYLKAAQMLMEQKK